MSGKNTTNLNFKHFKIAVKKSMNKNVKKGKKKVEITIVKDENSENVKFNMGTVRHKV
jgi:hypothetical protein